MKNPMHTKTTQDLEHEAAKMIELYHLRQLIGTLALLTATGGRKHQDIDALQARAQLLDADLKVLREN